MRNLLLLVVLWAATALPAQLVSAQSSNDVCATVLVPAMQGVGLDPAQSATVLGCEFMESSWQMRTIGDIQPGLISDTLDDRGMSIQASVDAMGMDTTFINALRFDRSTSTVYTIGAGNVVNTSDFSNENVGAGPNWLNNYADNYSQAMEVYLLNNGASNPELIEYMQWFMARRDATLQAITGNMDPMSSTAFQSNWGYLQWPWFWQLSDPHAIAAYMSATQPQPTVMPPPTSATNQNSSLTLSPSEVIVHPGDTLSIEIGYPRLQGIHTVAFMVYSEKSFVSNVPMVLVDTEGDFACSEGSDMDIVQPVERALDLLSTPDYPPTRLDIEISNEASTGDRLAVCVEMVGFSLEREIFSWNARIDIKVA